MYFVNSGTSLARRTLVLSHAIFDLFKNSIIYGDILSVWVRGMGASRYRVDLSEDEREHLRQVTRRGKAPARKVTRARILRKADEGLFDRQIAAALDVGMATVWRTRKRFVEEGLESALKERPRPGPRCKLNGKEEAHLIAVACSNPPEGHARWTLRLLADKVVELGFADSMSYESVRRTLKKTNSSPGRKRSGASLR